MKTFVPADRAKTWSSRVCLHPSLRANVAISRVNGRLLFIKKCMKSSLSQGGSVWRVTLLLGTTFLRANRPLAKREIRKKFSFVEQIQPDI